MKRIKMVLILLVLCLCPILVSAKGSITVNTKSITIEEGKTSSITIKASNAVGRVNISTDDASIAIISTKSQWLDNSNVTVKVTGKKIGKTQIKVKLEDAATYDNEVLNSSYTITVNVVEAKASNTSLKSISVKDYELENAGGGTYKLTVSNSVDKITILAEASDSKASVSGTGEKSLVIGENKFSVVVTAENGSKGTYTVIVTRKDDRFYLEDVNDFIVSDSDTLLLKDNDQISDDVANKLNGKDKTINLTKMNSNNQMIYSYVVNSKNITGGFKTDIQFTSKHEIEKKTNYAEGFNLVLDTNRPKVMQLKLKVSDKYKDGEDVNLYKYENDNLVLVTTLTVTGGAITFDLDNAEEYFVTKASFGGTGSNGVVNNQNTTSDKKGINIFMIIAIIELVGIVVLVILLVKKKGNEPEEKLVPITVATGANKVVAKEENVMEAKAVDINSVITEQPKTVDINTVITEQPKEEPPKPPVNNTSTSDVNVELSSVGEVVPNVDPPQVVYTDSGDNNSNNLY